MSCDESIGDLKQFEKNKYFYGKLMTVRDFETEQEYFNEKRHLLNRLIHGIGIVCGLEVKKINIKDSKMSLTLSPGVALDCCGNEIVVGAEYAGEELDVQGTVKPGNNYLYIRYNQCGKELDSVLGDVSTCEESYCHNRIKEIVKLELGDAPEIMTPKTTGSVENIIPISLAKFNPTLQILRNFKDVITPIESKEPTLEDSIKILRYISQNYYDKYLKSCPECKDPKVLLAVTDKDGKIDLKETNKYREIVYNNPMLYDLINSHTSDFNNPHHVTAQQLGALKSINGVNADSNGNIKLAKGPNIDLKPDNTNKTITISSSIDSVILNQLQSVFKYLRERSLKCTVTSFRELGQKFPLGSVALKADEISNFAKKAVDDRSYNDENEFMEKMNGKCYREIEEKELEEFSGKLKSELTLYDGATLSKAGDDFVITNRIEFPVIKEENKISIYNIAKKEPLLFQIEKKSDSELNQGKVTVEMIKGSEKEPIPITENATISNMGANNWIVSQGKNYRIRTINKLLKLCEDGLYQMEIALSKELENLMHKVSIAGLKDFKKSLDDLREAIKTGNLMEIAAAQDEVCFYASFLEITECSYPNIHPVANMIFVDKCNELSDDAKEVPRTDEGARVLNQILIKEGITTDELVKNTELEKETIKSVVDTFEGANMVSGTATEGFKLKFKPITK